MKDSDADETLASQEPRADSGYVESAADRHDFTTSPGSEDECACSSAPTPCADCKEYFADHPELWDCGSGYCDPNTGCPNCSDEDRIWIRRK